MGIPHSPGTLTYLTLNFGDTLSPHIGGHVYLSHISVFYKGGVNPTKKCLGPLWYPNFIFKHLSSIWGIDILDWFGECWVGNWPCAISLVPGTIPFQMLAKLRSQALPARVNMVLFPLRAPQSFSKVWLLLSISTPLLYMSAYIKH